MGKAQFLAWLRSLTKRESPLKPDNFIAQSQSTKPHCFPYKFRTDNTQKTKSPCNRLITGA